MVRLFDEDKLIIATHNKGKLAEFQSFLSPYVDEIISLADLNLKEPEETGTSFKDNALIKARAAAKESNLPALADDSGICVTALGNAPGIYSARWCGENKDPMVGMTRVHEELGDIVDRSGYFICVLALVWPDGDYEVVEGRSYGHIVWPPRGDKGHGYDPFFVPEEGNGFSFGEMIQEAKADISHRGHAIRKLLPFFKKNYTE